MPNEQIDTYIRESLAQGASKDAVQQALRASGWEEAAIAQSFARVNGVSGPAPAPTPAPIAVSVSTVSPDGATLQQRYPLSPKKFTKKMVQETGVILFIAFFLGMIFAYVGAIIELAMNQTTNAFGSMLSLWFYTSAVTFVVLEGFFAWYVREYIRRYYYDSNDNYITIRKGVFATAEIHVQYSKVQDVYVDQDILDRSFGLYDVHLASATITSGIEAHIDGVEREVAEGLKQMLLQKLEEESAGGQTHSGSTPVSEAPLQDTPVTFDKEISSRTYPITGAWYVQKFFSAFVTAALIVLVVVPYLFADRGGTSIAAMFNLDSGTFVPTMIISGIGMFILSLAGSYLWARFYSFEFLPDYIVVRTGIISKQEKHVPYRVVQDVLVQQGIIERALGIATVTIQNAVGGMGAVQSPRTASGIIVPGQPLAKAKELSETVRRVVLTKNSTGTGL